MSEHNGHASYTLREVVRLLASLSNEELSRLRMEVIPAEFRVRRERGDEVASQNGKGPVRV